MTDTVYMAGVFVKWGEAFEPGAKGFPILMTRKQRDDVLKSPHLAARLGAYVLEFLQEHAPQGVPHDGGEYKLLFLNVEANAEAYTEVLEQLRQGREDPAEFVVVDITILEVGKSPTTTSRTRH